MFKRLTIKYLGEDGSIQTRDDIASQKEQDLVEFASNMIQSSMVFRDGQEVFIVPGSRIVSCVIAPTVLRPEEALRLNVNLAKELKNGGK